MPAHCTNLACARATASPSLPITAWITCSIYSACWRSARLPHLVSITFLRQTRVLFRRPRAWASSSTPTILSIAVRRAALNSADGRIGSIGMDGPQPNAESLPDLLKADFKSPPDPADEDAIAHLSYTSGTTGKPKGACLAHEPTMRAANCIAERLRITSDDVSFRTDRFVEALSAGRQSAATAPSRRHRVDVMRPLDPADRLGCAGRNAGNHPGRQSDTAHRSC